MAENDTTIEQLESILNAGALSGTVDGQQVSFASPSDIRRRIRELRDADDDVRRPRAATIKLSGF